MTVATARSQGLSGCRTCGRVSDARTAICPRCGSAVHQRIPHSLQRVLALLLMGFACYLPANILPMLLTRTLGRAQGNTIVGGVIELAHHGAWDIAAIVFLASVVIPCAKFVIILYLVWSIRFHVRLPVHRRIHLYEVVEFIGRWSMIDVFVVAILTALVQLGFIVSVNPGPAAIFFALSVAFTMLSAQCLDPRLIWDSADEQETTAHG